MKIISQKQFDSIHAPKGPFDYSNHVGVEIEFISALNQFEMKQWFIQNDLDKHIEMKQDGSVRVNADHPFSYEIAIVAKEEEIYKVVKKVCKILRGVKSMVNKSCGLHVHLDMRNRDKETVFFNLVNAQPLLYSMNPASRNGGHSPPTRSSTWAEATRTGTRSGINPFAFDRHRTLEVRIHAGSLNATKINNWIKLLLLIASKKERLEKFEKVADFYQAYQIDTAMIEYIEQRLGKFKADKEKLPNVA